MLHRHDFTAVSPKLSPPRRPDPEPLAAADYLRLRRMALGLSERELAKRMAAVWEAGTKRSIAVGDDAAIRVRTTVRDLIGQMLLVVQALELPSAVARRRETINAMALVLPIDPDVYWQLATAAPNRHPRVCRGCGASTHDAGDPVTWSTTTKCARCASPAGPR